MTEISKLVCRGFYPFIPIYTYLYLFIPALYPFNNNIWPMTLLRPLALAVGEGLGTEFEGLNSSKIGNKELNEYICFTHALAQYLYFTVY